MQQALKEKGARMGRRVRREALGLSGEAQENEVPRGVTLAKLSGQLHPSCTSQDSEKGQLSGSL